MAPEESETRRVVLSNDRVKAVATSPCFREEEEERGMRILLSRVKVVLSHTSKEPSASSPTSLSPILAKEACTTPEVEVLMTVVVRLRILW